MSSRCTFLSLTTSSFPQHHHLLSPRTQHMPKPRTRRFRRSSSEPFNPLRLLSQILLLQSIYYATALILILFTTQVAGRPFELGLVFSWRAIRGDTTVGWTLGVVWMCCALAMVIAQLVIVARSKLVLDFSLTIHFLNLLVSSLYEREIPSELLWWGLQVASAVLMVGLATWACRWRELRPMTFGIGGGGVGEGSGRGEYEMVAVKEEEGEEGV